MATVSFTVRGIDSIKLSEIERWDKEGRTYFWDESTLGFGLRVSKTGRKSWIVMYRHYRQFRRMTLGTYPTVGLADARERAKKILGQVANGQDPAQTKQMDRNAETFFDLAKEYIERHAKVKKKSWEADERVLNKDFLPALGTMKAKDVARKDILRILDEISDRGSPTMANRSLEVVRKMFNFGVERDIVPLNPCYRISRPNKENQRDRVLAEEEIRKVWAALCSESKIIATIVKLRLITAQRGQEVLSMQWQDIDFKTRWWTVPKEHSKNGLSHRVPLSNLAIQALHEWMNEGIALPWVFPSPKGEGHIEWVRKAIGRIRKSCDVDFVAHDLRRTAASFMTSIGIPRLVVSKILNHVESGVTAVYDRHSYDPEKREALKRWDAKLSEIIRGQITEFLGSPKEEELHQLNF